MWRIMALNLALGIALPGAASALDGSLSVLKAPADVPRADTIRVDETLQEVRLTDGSVVVGRVIQVAGERVTVETPGGVRINLQRSQIESLSPARGRVVDGRLWRPDPNRTRLFFAPTARALDRGEGYLASYMLFFPFVAVGVTDRLTMAGGTPILPGVVGEILYLAPKVTVTSRPGVDLAVGTLAFFSTGELDHTSRGVLYGTGTFGDIERALTVGMGWGFAVGGGESSISSDPVFQVGGELRTSEFVKLLTENWLFSSEALLTGGVRFFGERLSADLGIGMSVGNGNAKCCMPLVNFVYMVGGR